MMKSPILCTLLVLISTIACKPNVTEDLVEIKHFNFLIASDLTNRVDKKENRKSVHDTLLINAIVNTYVEIILPYKRSIGQKDKLAYSRISNLNRLQADRLYSIDLTRFQNQGERIKYLKKGGFTKDIKAFKESIAANYQDRNTYSGDILKFFKLGINALNTELEISENVLGSTTYKNSYQNVLFLFTDGYIEAGNYDRAKACEANRCRFLNDAFIHEIRMVAERKGISVKQVIEEEDYGLVPVNNPLLKNWEIVVLEMDDRSLTRSGSSSYLVSDLEIAQAIWAKWLYESGFKKVTMLPVTNDVNSIGPIVTKYVLDE